MKEWELEPNYLSFIHQNFKCEIKRSHIGALNAYVHVPETNIYYGLDELTLNELLKFDVEISYAEPQSSLWVIGISFSHIKDYVPNITTDYPDFMKELEIFCGHKAATEAQYKNIEFAIEKIKALAEKLVLRNGTNI